MVSGIIRKTLERGGYWIRPRAVLPFGIDYALDIQRLAKIHGIPIRCIFDIGAHEGQTAREVLDAFPGAEVHSFEPHPVSFSHLKAIHSPRFHAHELAMSDSSGMGTFFEYPEPEAGHASMCNSLEASAPFAVSGALSAIPIKVYKTTVDAFCAEHRIYQIDVLKIDTEGHEAAVLNGAMTMLAQGTSFVFLEYNTIQPTNGSSGGALAPIAALLESSGYKLIASYPVYMTHEPIFATFNGLFVHRDIRTFIGK